MIVLRDYQQRVFDDTISWVRSTTDPAIIDVAPAGGKSMLVAAIAEALHGFSRGKKVLCLAPSKELVEQNHSKFLMTGNPASIYSASVGRKCLKHPVIYATPKTVKNNIRRFGDDICMIIIDECHEWGDVLVFIIDKLREKNPNLRVLGLSGTPFRTGEGYIYKMDENGKTLSEEVAKNPYFMKCVSRVSAREMLDNGFLCSMRIGEVNAQQYDTSSLAPNTMNKFSNKALEKAFVGQGRKTALIVADVVNQAQTHPGGVMLFAATRQHAQEIFESLPKGNAGIVTGETSKKADRKRYIEAYKNQEIRYLVSVGTLTTGFDAPWTSIIAIMRKSESPSLVQQMLGRAWRIWDETCDGFDPEKHVAKDHSIFLDYAENIDYHFPDGDIYAPEIRPTFKGGEEASYIPAKCATCDTVNEFSARPNPSGLSYDDEGYFCDLAGNRIETDSGPMPGHYGRRCQGYNLSAGEYLQCSQRWSFKECPVCASENDIAARYCKECKAEIIDPNEKLILDFKQYKKDPTNIHTDTVTKFNTMYTKTKRDIPCIRIDFGTDIRSFSIWYFPQEKKGLRKVEYDRLMAATDGLKKWPKTVTYKKDSKSKFFKVFAFNQEPDEIADVNKGGFKS